MGCEIRQDGFAAAAWEECHAGGLRVWRSPVLAAVAGLAHGFTATSLNLSLSFGPGAERAAEDRRAVCSALRLDPDRLVSGRQVHGVTVACVECDGSAGPRVIADTDGLVTTARGVPLLALSADCPLIVAVDAAAGALGVAHSGWRGSVAGMPVKLIEALVAHCGAHASRVVAAVSPCAGPDAYEIRDDVRTLVEQAMGDAEPYLARSGGGMFLNLPRLIAVQLAGAGVLPERIHLPAQCSITDERFHSVRRNGPNSGHAGLIAGWV
ncbi:MAG TPA: polyphenol oxidase family protein [Phycisphaerae bacterium]|nr:laccase domain-containing protein [Phycisphaerales bacterium]HRX83438.1 polyphenol oxidase family protein [Phycisphaerae bacterium]